ncbi:MAG: hypothetical protein M3Y58_05455 [Chloroflexota bacterium]|nr:hypothetical protein [Chloroflexota bacterium]
MLDARYPPSVAALLTIGNERRSPPPATEPMLSLEEMQNSKSEPAPYQSNDWLDYLQFGIRPEHLPDLLAMITDESLYNGAVDSPEAWASLHAWRAIGQLRVTEAIEPLVGLLDELEDWDFFREEAPDVFGMIGPAALPALATFFRDPSHLMYARVVAGNAIAMIGRMHPETRDQCIAILVECLAAYAENEPDFNAMVASMLLDLEAVEALPTIRRAYDADAVDVMHLGDWEDVEIAFGVRTQRDTPRPRYNPLGFDLPDLLEKLAEVAAGEERAKQRRDADKKAKHKKKMADKSRRQNRKKK